MRIIAGQRRGLKLTAPAGLATRPSSDRLREALFNILESSTPRLHGAPFLDLFAGSGAVGLEAFSRGAAPVVFVERDRSALAALAANITRARAQASTQVIAADATKLKAASQAFPFVFLDPPYGMGLLPATMTRLAARGWLSPGARVMGELAAEEAFEPPEGFELEDERRYGAGRILMLRYRSRGEGDIEG